MRLIDADELKESLDKGSIIIDEDILKCDSVHEILVYLLEKLDVVVAEKIDEQPTVDDVNTVCMRIVDRLEEYRGDFMCDIYEELREDSDNLRANRIIDRFDEAIEIVKEEIS